MTTKKGSASGAALRQGSRMEPALPLGEIGWSPHQKRRVDEDAPGFKELVKSVKAQGVLEPVIVRENGPLLAQHDGETYILIAGERRVRAARKAGFSTIPAVVRNGDQLDAAAATAAENLQREDLTVMEEAETIQGLLDGGLLGSEVARLIGRSESWVSRRASVTRLAEVWKTALADREDGLGGWSASHLELLARFPENVQEKIYARLTGELGLQYMRKSLEASDLEARVGGYTNTLSMAPWGFADTDLVKKAGPCSLCTKRSCLNPALFDDKAITPERRFGQSKPPPGDRCLDPACWQRKAAAHLKRTEAALREKHGDVIRLSRFGGKATTSNSDVDVCKKGDAGAKPAIHVDGPQKGKTGWVKPRRGTSATPAKARAVPLKERRRQLLQKRVNVFQERLDDAVSKAKLNSLDLGADRVVTVARLAAIFLGDWYKEAAELARLDPQPPSDQEVVELVWKELPGAIMGCAWQTYRQPQRARKAMSTVWRILGRDPDEVWKKLCDELPEPEEWKGLKADGTRKKVKKAKAKKAKRAKKGA